VQAATTVDSPAAILDVSVVVPVKDERENVGELCARVADVLRGEALRFELIFVDDGSTDGSWGAILELCAAFDEARAVRQRRNFGKAAALATGFAFARGAVIVTMDGDLQDDPGEIPRFLTALRAGHDVVSGWKRVRHDPLSKRLPSRLFNAVTRRVSGVPLHDFNCGFKAYTRQAARALAPFIYGEMHRYLPVLLAAQGFRIGEIEVEHHARRFGRSKYGARRMLAGACDVLTVVLITRFRERPLHVFGALAGLIFLATLALGTLLALAEGVPSAIAALLSGTAAAVTLVGTGLICELVVHGFGPARAGSRMAEAVRLPGLGDVEAPGPRAAAEGPLEVVDPADAQ
jgi:glycosyltransferase involved in cell wall biosynthesis